MAKTNQGFSTFDSRVRKSAEMSVTDALMHNLSYLDEAAKMAINNEDPEMLMQIFKQGLKITDRIVQVAFHTDEEEEIINERVTGNTGFGFERATEGISDNEADDQ